MSNTLSKKEKVYQAIKHAIITRRLELAKIYTIAELSEVFGGGKTPAREALVILASEELMIRFPGLDIRSSPSQL